MVTRRYFSGEGTEGIYFISDNYHTEQNRFPQAQRRIGKKIDVKKGLARENVGMWKIKAVGKKWGIC